MAEGIKPKCDFCDKPAVYDAKTEFGPWGFMCEEHFEKFGSKVPGLYKRLVPEGTKRCRICGKEKPVSEFYTYTDHNGVTRLRTECIECNLKNRKGSVDNE